MFFEDLSRYSYFPEFSNYDIVNVGWLDSQHDYPKGGAQEQVNSLIKYYKFPANKTCGFHPCQFCHSTIFCKILGKEYFCGTAEIWLQGTNGVIYACPDLIYHYIMDHNYLPPKEFLDALDSGAQVVIPSLESRSFILADVNHKNCLPENQPSSHKPLKMPSFLKRIFRKVF